MIPETETVSYLGVVCLHCKQPVAISAMVAGMKEEASGTRGQKCQVFHVRCSGCGKEKPYKTSEIREFLGEAPEAPGIHPVSARPGEHRIHSRAANA
jgi:hypothetical protein